MSSQCTPRPGHECPVDVDNGLVPVNLVASLRHPIRNLAGSILANLAVVVAGLSLMAFFASVAAQRAQSTFSPADLLKAEQAITAQIGHVDPHLAGDSQAQAAVQQSLQNPSVVSDYMRSPSVGSQTFNDTLARLDPALAPALAQNQLRLGSGIAVINNVEKGLRSAAILGGAGASLLALIALLISARRDRVLHRIGQWAVMVSIFAVLVGWVLPWWVQNHATGSIRSVASFFSNGQTDAHAVYLALFILGVAMLVMSSLVRQNRRTALA